MCKVLIVEDHGESRRALSRLLDGWGHTVSAADSLASALRFIEQKMFDVILSDIELPDGNGYEFAAEIRNRKLRSTTAALTARNSEADLRAADRAGFDHHFAKPLDTARLRTWLDAVAMQS